MTSTISITSRIAAIRERLETLNAEFDALQAEVAERDRSIKRKALGIALVTPPTVIDLSDRVYGDLDI